MDNPLLLALLRDALTVPYPRLAGILDYELRGDLNYNQTNQYIRFLIQVGPEYVTGRYSAPFGVGYEEVHESLGSADIAYGHLNF